MTKKELIDRLQKNMGTSTTNSGDYMLHAVCDTIAQCLIDGHEVPLPGIGKIIVKPTAARTARNPKTGQPVQVPAGRKAVLRVGKELREAL